MLGLVWGPIARARLPVKVFIRKLQWIRNQMFWRRMTDEVCSYEHSENDQKLERVIQSLKKHFLQKGQTDRDCDSLSS